MPSKILFVSNTANNDRPNKRHLLKVDQYEL
jgi:hypothetical protein